MTLAHTPVRDAVVAFLTPWAERAEVLGLAVVAGVVWGAVAVAVTVAMAGAARRP